MAGRTNGQPSGSHPQDIGAQARHVTRDRVQLYADRVASPSARHAAELRARAEAMLQQPGVLRFGRQPARRAARPKRAVIASALATTTMLLGGASALAAGGGATHTVEAGDTLSALALHYRTTVDDLARINAIPDPDLIVVGDELHISDATPAGSYTVVAGDTIEDIAAQHGITVHELVTLNALDNSDLLQIGQRLLLPAASGAAPADAGNELVGPLGGAPAADDSGQPEAPAADSTAPDSAATASGSVDLISSGNAPADSVPADEAAPADGVTADGATADASSDASADSSDAGASDATAANADSDASASGNAPAAAPDEAVSEDANGATAADATTADAADNGSASDASVTPAPVETGSATLHLVLPGETLASIAALYDVTPDQLVAANAHATDGVSAGMILKIPSAELSGIQLVGMPVATEASAGAAEAAAVEVATGYWAAPIAQDEVLAQLPVSDDPHQGYRAADDYGVYAEPLADLLERYGFHSGVFYGDADTLTAQLDSGIPVIVWVTQDMQAPDAELAPYTDGVNDFNLAPDKQAAVVYGYDDSGVFIVDVSDGQYKHVAWDDFQRAWDAFGDMALAVAPI